MEKIKCAKAFFWTSFIISAIFFIVSVIIAMTAHNVLTNMAADQYNLSAAEFERICALSMSLWKILIIQFTLIPALALTILDKKCKNKDV